MNSLYQESEGLLPGIHLDKVSGKFKIYGTSCPMDPFEIYNPVFEWFNEYFQDPLQETVLDLNMNYYNTASSKFLLRIMCKLEDLSKEGHKVKINWYYSEEDEDMLEEGEEFEHILDLDFNIISLESGEETEEDDAYFERILNDEF